MHSDEKVVQRALETIKRWNMINHNEHILIGVSGGPDSVALLYILKHLQQDWNLSLSAVHLHHGIRGQDADLDLEYVVNLTRSLDIPLYYEYQDVKEIAREYGLSLEEAGRKARYALYLSVANEVGANRVALGHHRDDVAETVLMNLLRGTGISGMAGIPPVRKHDGLLIVRPLLDVPKGQLVDFCFHRGVLPREDTTNQDKRFYRNRVRHELLPYLEENYQENVREHLVRLAMIMRDEEEFLEKYTEKIYRESLVGENGLSLLKLRNLDMANLRRILRFAYRQFGKGDLNFANVDNMITLVTKGQSGDRVDLPGGIFLQREYERILFGDDAKRVVVDEEIPLVVPGNTEVLGISVYTKILHVNEVDWDRIDGQSTAVFDYDEIHGLPLNIRTRRDGDRFRPFGLAGSKKIKDLFIDLKVPRKDRDLTPLLCLLDEILWVIFYRQSDRYSVSEKTKRVLLMEVRHKE